MSLTERIKLYSRLSNYSRGEEGAILPFLAISAVVVVLFVGLSIDTSQLIVSRVRQEHNAERVASAALHAWKNSNASTELQKIIIGRDKAQSMLDKNYMFSDGNRADPTLRDTVGDTVDDYAHVQYGKWFFDDPGCSDPASLFSPTAPCPCPSNIFRKPCFLEMTDSEVSSGVEKINSYRVSLSVPESNPIKTFFMGIAGAKTSRLNSVATAALYPKNVVFLVDLSRSAFRESHFVANQVQTAATDITGYPGDYLSFFLSPYIDGSINMSFASEYGYGCGEATVAGCQPHIKTGVPTNTVLSCSSPSACTFASFPSQASDPASPAAAAISFSPSDLMEPNQLWTNNLASLPQRDDASHSLQFRNAMPKHYMDDFIGLELAQSTKYGFYYVDAHCQVQDHIGVVAGYMLDCAGTDNVGPEPISSILSGLNHSYKLLQPFDSSAFIGFDDVLDNYYRRFHSGVSVPTDLNDPLIVAPPFSVAAGSDNLDIMQRLREVIDVEEQSYDYFSKRVQHHHFLPFFGDDLDLPRALNEAANLLANASNSALSENMVILLSDGLSNCLAGSCGKTYSDYVASMSDVESVLSGRYVDSGIEFHFVHTGEHSGAHKLFRKGMDPTESACLDDNAAELGSFNISDVKTCNSCADPDNCTACSEAQTDWDSMLVGTGVFYGSTNLSRLALLTGGSYRPIIPPCDPEDLQPGMSIAECSAGDFERLLPGLCNSSPTAPGSVLTDSRFTDSHGRFKCEVGCRSKREQIKISLSQILENPSYVVVE